MKTKIENGIEYELKDGNWFRKSGIKTDILTWQIREDANKASYAINIWLEQAIVYC